MIDKVFAFGATEDRAFEVYENENGEPSLNKCSEPLEFRAEVVKAEALFNERL